MQLQQSLVLYQLITEGLSEKPDLSIIQKRGPVPEEWPLILKSVETFRKQIQSFTVSDGKNSVRCRSDLMEVYNRVAGMDLGSIIHLIGSAIMYDDATKQYILKLDNVVSLKEYDDLLKQRRAEAESRARQLEEEGFLDAYRHVEYVNPKQFEPETSDII